MNAACVFGLVFSKTYRNWRTFFRCGDASRILARGASMVAV